MALAYLGAANAFTETSNSGLDTDLFGFDQLTRTYEGPPSKLAAFLRTWPVNKQDAEFPWLYLVARPAPKLSPVVEISLQFKGSLERHHKTQTGSDTRLQPLQLKNDAGRTTAEYYGPVSWWRYIVHGPHPTALAHKGEMHLTNFTYELFNLRGPGTIKIAGSASGSTTVSAGVPVDTEYTLQPRVITSRFTCEQVGGCWQVTEENEGRLEPPEFRPMIGQR